MENTIRVKSKSEYIIEVNDKKETISFDMEDAELMLKLDNAVLMIDRIRKDAILKEETIKKHQDEKGKGLLTKNERELQEVTVNMYKEMRKAADEFLGKGACQKIFGDKNFITMYDELFEQLAPHFTKMKLNAEKFKKEIENKYGDIDEDIL